MKGVVIALILMALCFLSVGLVGGAAGTIVGYYAHSIGGGMLAGFAATAIFVIGVKVLPVSGFLAFCAQIVFWRMTALGIVLDALWVAVTSGLGTFIALAIGGFWGVSLAVITASILGAIGTYFVSTFVKAATCPLISPKDEQ